MLVVFLLVDAVGKDNSRNPQNFSRLRERLENLHFDLKTPTSFQL
jgi:hypothetical protein